MKCVHSSSRVNNETLLSQSTMVARKEPIDPVLVETKSVLSRWLAKLLVIMRRLMLHAQQQVGKKHHQYSATFKAEVIVMMD